MPDHSGGAIELVSGYLHFHKTIRVMADKPESALTVRNNVVRAVEAVLHWPALEFLRSRIETNQLAGVLPGFAVPDLIAQSDHSIGPGPFPTR